MAINYAQLFNRRSTPQSQPIPDSNQVFNSGGGYSWQIDDWTRLDRFLILGAEGGTYYIAERELVKQNHDAIIRCIKADGIRAVNRVVEISDAGRAPKNYPAIFALALVVTHGDAQAKTHAFANLGKVCRIGTHLFHFAEYVNAMRGWGRGLRNAVAGWYVSREADDLAHQAVKYQQRDGWSHSDLLRLAHPKAPSREHEAVFRWMLAGADSLGEREVNRKVGKMTSIGLVQPLSESAKLIVRKLGDETVLKRARIHPLAVLIAERVYAQGKGDKGSLTWKPVPRIVDALDAAFYATFKNVEPCAKPVLLALDVSGSMGGGSVAGSCLTPRAASAAMALVTA